MRLFAYGGTRYEVRNRIGEWPADFGATSAFEDLHALPAGGALTYGVGLRPSPALIIRQRQNETDRGGYAYTIFLDPGDELWRRFEWNGASLLQAARADDTLWSALLREPERLASSFLDARLQHLSPAQRPAARLQQDRRFLELLTDAAVFGAPIVIGPQASPPDPERMASVLDALPIAFRCGRGWMIGGRSGTGDKFGTALIFDHAAAGQHPASSGALEALESTLSGGYSPPLEALLAEPVHVWPADSARVANHWMLLARVVAGTPDEGVADVDGQDILAPDLRRALAAQTTGTRWPARLSRWMLDGYPKPAAIPPAVWHRANLAALAEYLREHNVSPASPEVAPFAMSPDDIDAIWEAQIATAPRDRTVQLVDTAARHLTFDPRGRPGRLAKLIDAALSRPASERPRAREWESLRQSPIWDQLEPRLLRGVREETPGDDDWALDYLFQGRDPAGEWLLAKHGRAIVEDVAAVALSRVADKHVGAAAGSWLDAIAQSPVRRQLSMAIKERIARAIDGNWRSMTQLSGLLAGEQVVTPLRAGPAESAALVDELAEMVNAYATGMSMPPAAAIDLERIASLVNASLPIPVLELIVEHFSLTASSIAWLRRQGHRTLAAKVWQSEWRTMPDASAQCTADELAEVLPALLAPEVPPLDLVELLGRVNPEAIDGVVARHSELRKSMATSLLDPHTVLSMVDAAVPRLQPATWDQLLDEVVSARPSQLLDLIGAIAESRVARLGSVVYRYLERHNELRETIATGGWGRSWGDAAPTILAVLSPGESPEDAVAEPQTPSRPRKRR